MIPSANSLVLVKESDPGPAGKTLENSGIAWIAGTTTVVVIYR